MLCNWPVSEWNEKKKSSNSTYQGLLTVCVPDTIRQSARVVSTFRWNMASETRNSRTDDLKTAFPSAPVIMCVGLIYNILSVKEKIITSTKRSWSRALQLTFPTLTLRSNHFRNRCSTSISISTTISERTICVPVDVFELLFSGVMSEWVRLLEHHVHAMSTLRQSVRCCPCRQGR